MKRTLTALLLALAMVLSLAACGSQPGSQSQTGSDSTVSSTPAGDSSTSADETEDDTDAAPLTEEDVYARMEEIISDPEHPLAAAGLGVIKDGEIIFADTVGVSRFNAEDASKNIPANKDTKYRIASISKLCAAIGAWQLIEQGKIDPDADVSDYLGFELRNPNYPDTPITVRMLMSHTSSIREGGDNSGSYSIPYGHDISEFFTPGSEYACEEPWAPEGQAPGEYFSYANMNYCLLATIMEKVSGERFDRYMTDHVFAPMGLTCSYNVASMDPAAQEQVGTLYRKFNEAGEYDPANGTWTAQVDDFTDGYPTEDYADYEIGTNGSLFGPMGSLRISIPELCAIMQMFSNDGTYNGVQILKPETIDEMFTPVWTYDPELENGDTYYDLMLCYGMGPQIFTSTIGDSLVADQVLPFAGHTAEAYGLLGGMAFDRETGNGLVYIVGGTGCDMDDYYGEYSSFYGWEEALLTLGAEYANFDY